MNITNIVASSGTVYYHPTDLTADFDPASPTANGWTAYTPTASQPIQAIAVVHGNTKLCQADGEFTITVYGEAKDFTNTPTPLGYEFPYTAEVATPDTETRLDNNTAEHSITTP